jgi:hypothetical protein
VHRLTRAGARGLVVASRPARWLTRSLQRRQWPASIEKIARIRDPESQKT